MVTIGNDYVSVGLFHRWTENVRFPSWPPYFALNILQTLIYCMLTLPIPFTNAISTFFILILASLQTRQVEDVDNFLIEVLEDFVSQGHLQELVALRDQLSDIAAEKANLETDRADVLNAFKPFEPVVEALRAKYALAETITEE